MLPNVGELTEEVSTDPLSTQSTEQGQAEEDFGQFNNERVYPPLDRNRWANKRSATSPAWKENLSNKYKQGRDNNAKYQHKMKSSSSYSHRF